LSKLLPAALATFAALFVLASCGGGGETTAALTKAEFIAQGDEICAKGDEDGQAKADKFAEDRDIDVENPTEAELEEVMTKAFVPVLRQEAEELSELGLPEGEEEQAEAIVASLEKATEEIEDEPGRAFSATDTPLKEVSKLANEFGFENCGS